jgi:transaldolase
MIKQLYLDSANVEHIAALVETDAVAGVTTNPSLMAKEPRHGSYVDSLLRICEVIEGHAPRRKHLSVEVATANPTEMTLEALKLHEVLTNVGFSKIDLHVKVPIMLETLPVITELRQAKLKVNVTACMQALQAKLAEDAGAEVVSFFYNRMLDGAVDACDEIRKYCLHLRRSANVICGSIREPNDILNCWMAGAEFVTAPAHVIAAMARHRKTGEAIAAFQKDIERWQG